MGSLPETNEPIKFNLGQVYATQVLALTLFMDETSKNNFDTLFKAQTQKMTPHSKEIQNLRIKWCELFNSYFLLLTITSYTPANTLWDKSVLT